MQNLTHMIMGALFLTLILYMIFKTIALKLRRSRGLSRIIGFIVSALLSYGLGTINIGYLASLLYVGTAAFWFIVDTLREITML